MFKIDFSVLSYHPSFLTDESINVGILFHCKETNTKFFKTTQNWTRLEKFDDELDIGFARIFLESIEEEINEKEAIKLFEIKEKFNIQDFIRFYVNEFKFSIIHTVEVNDFNDFIEDTSKIYLRYDFDKKARPKKKEELAFLKLLLKDKNIKSENKVIKGLYEDSIVFDYVLGDFGIKLFNFEEKGISKMINHIKAWAYNSEELKEQYKIIITYTKDNDFDIEKNIHFQAIQNIVNNSHIDKIIEFDKCLNFLGIKG